MKEISATVNKKKKKSLTLKLYFVVALLVLVSVMISCTYGPNWSISVDELEDGDQSQVEMLAHVTLEWDPNMESDLEGYKLYYGVESRNYSYIIDVGNQTSYTITELQIGETYYFSVSAYNTAGYEGDYSNEVFYTVPVEG